jgi:mono/diheme cytochrome c family protein
MRLIRMLVIALAIALAALAMLRRPQLAAAERGRRVAEHHGCFGCHGPGGRHGAANPGRSDRTVPGFAGDLMMYAKTAAEVREWIQTGAPARRRSSATWREQRARGTLVMPAFGSRLSSRELDDLVAYVLAVHGAPAPADSQAAAGLERADALGCTGCHGAGGRLSLPNPGSLKGYVPSWDGEDFPELVHDRAEFEQWVRKGVSRRMAANPAATFFLRRAPVRMPPYEEHLVAGDLDALWAYVRWLRSDAARPQAAAIE